MSMLNELFEDAEPLNERPYSRTQSAVDSAKGGVKGMFGSGQVESGAKESGELANRLWVEFKRMIGRKYGKAQSSVPFADVAAFFKSNKLDTSGLGSNPNLSFSPKDVGKALLDAARKQITAQYDQGDDEPKSDNEQGTPPPTSQPPASPAPAPASTGTPPASGSGSDTGLEGRLAGLSKSERDQLLAMLS